MTKVDIFEKVARIVADQAKISLENVVPETNCTDIGLDSLDKVEILMEVEEEFDVEISDQEAQKLETVEDLVNLINGRLNK